MNTFNSRWVRSGRTLAIQVLIVAVSYLGSYAVRFDFSPHDIPWNVMLRTLVVVLAARAGAFVLFGLHRVLWRHLGTEDLDQILKATSFSSAALLAAVVGARSLEVDFISGIPLGVLLLDWGGSILGLGGARLGARLYRRRAHRIEASDQAASRVLIVGAGDAGAAIGHQMVSEPRNRLTVVAFADDDGRKHGAFVAGAPIAGALDEIPRLVEEHDADLIIIAMPSATPDEMSRAVRFCQQSGARFRTVPSLGELATGAPNLSNVRDVDVADLLGRPMARLDHGVIREFIAGKRVMVTGAGGSVGSELAGQIARLEPAQLVLIDHAENSLFFIAGEFGTGFPNLNLVSRVVDVTDASTVTDVMTSLSPQIVFHAAAHKHVPLMEDVPIEAVRNNVGGTLVMADAVDAAGVECFVFVSTDKAVNPSNVMGATKRLGELLLSSVGTHSRTRFVSVRFGNVLGSTGSVIPIFKRQIARGGPVTVTHPAMERYFMALPEAAGLILEAGAVGKRGQILMLDMGEPMKIVTVAETLIRLSGYEPYEEIDIVFTGPRPGEKLSESLNYDGEEFIPTDHEKLLGYLELEPDPLIEGRVRALLERLPNLEAEEVRAALWDLVQPEPEADKGAGGVTDSLPVQLDPSSETAR